MTRPTKQVIVMRRDLNMRKGKMISQGAHSSLGAVLKIQDNPKPEWIGPLKVWLDASFTKICVSVDSHSELLDILAKAEQAGHCVKLITDSGLTEFHGVPTDTCLAIGPSWSDEIDLITKDLKLL